MVDKEDILGFIVGSILIFTFFYSTIHMFAPRSTGAYDLGVSDAFKEAFERGYMTKEIDKDDNVIYRWVEPHKLSNYENENK